jgi:hypothetical protein
MAISLRLATSSFWIFFIVTRGLADFPLRWAVGEMNRRYSLATKHLE